VSVYNLRTGTEYFYNGIFTLTDGTKLTLSGSFKTEAGPRLMHIDGLVNVRDLGGWITADGKTVKQGLLYRGSEMDGLVEEKFKLTPQGLEQMKALGIKTDLDLRHEGETVLEGEHILYNAIQYEYAFTDAGKDAVRRLFADLADPANYPAYLHCTYGADRTGTMCYLLLGLLGVSDADLKRDYELTALYYGCVSPAQMDPFVAKIAALPGENTQARVEYFLESAGVTRDQMDSIRQIFLG
jgi:protein-tyrosine phosphatase